METILESPADRDPLGEDSVPNPTAIGTLPSDGSSGRGNEAEARPLGPDDPVSSYLRRAFRRNAALIVTRAAEIARVADPEGLHELRVAARRLRSCLRVFRDELRPRPARRAAGRLRALGAATGTIRNLDVLIEGARTYAEGLCPARSRAFVSVLESLELRRDAAVSEFRGFIASAGGRDLFKALRALERRKILTCRGRRWDLSASLAAPVAVVRCYADLLAYDAALSGPVPDGASCHPARGAAKRLRYTMELLQDAMGPGADRCVQAVKGLQDRLGAISDGYAAVSLMTELVTRTLETTQDPSSGMAGAALSEAARYLSYLQRKLEARNRSFAAQWRAVASPAFRKRLFLALAAPPPGSGS